MPAYDFLSGVASAVEKQSNALQAYGLQKREQEREQQERTQYNQVFTELGQFLASGQEIPEERIQTWTQMMGAAPTEIVTAFSNAMNTLGNRREEQQYRTAQTGIAQEGLNLQKQQLRQGASEFDRILADAVAERTWRSREADLDRKAQRQIAGMQMSNRQMEETFNRVRMLQAQYAYAENDDTRKAIEQQINKALGINVSNTPQDRGASKTPQEWIQSLGNIDDATARTRLLSIRNQFQEGSADRKSVNDAILLLSPDVPNSNNISDVPIGTQPSNATGSRWFLMGDPENEGRAALPRLKTDRERLTSEYNSLRQIAINKTDRESKPESMRNETEKKRELDRVISKINSIERTLRNFEEYRRTR